MFLNFHVIFLILGVLMIYASYNIPDYMIYMVPSGMHAAEKWLDFNNEPYGDPP